MATTEELHDEAEEIARAYVEGDIDRPEYHARLFANHAAQSALYKERTGKSTQCVCMGCREVRGQ